MLKLRKSTTPSEPLILVMAAVRMGDRLLVLGADAPKVLAQLALKPGLTGRTCVVDDNEARVQRAVSLAEAEGGLVEAQTVPVTSLPYQPASFDIVVVNHLLPRLETAQRTQCLAEAARVLRGGGRCVVIQAGRPSGIAGLLGGGSCMPPAEVETLLTTASFRAVHTLAERDGLLFVEGARRT
jgi:ubiquinone/menaquinone biosynthesis C-methylase UbiE